MTRRRIAALWLLAVAVFTAALMANGVGDTTAYFTDSHQGSISFSLADPTPSPDTTGPAFTAPPDQAIEATGPAGALATYANPTAIDAVDGPVPVSCLPASGSMFALAATSVTCSSTDAAHNTTSHTFTITVVDTTKPVIAPHDDVIVEATSPGGAPVTFTAPATSDAVSGAGLATCSLASGSLFAIGTTRVECDAVDAAGNDADQASFDVSVVDTTAPVFAVPADKAVPATGPSGAVVSWATPVATDAVDGTDPVSCLPASGATFPIGDTTVTCTSADRAGNQASHRFTITVASIRDVTDPVIAPHADVIAEATGPAGAEVAYAAPATSDARDGRGVATCTPAPGSLFPLGSTIVECEAVDAAGNHAAGTHFAITVVDTTGPLFKAPADQAIPATGSSGAVATWATQTATDAVDGTDLVSCLPASGSPFPIGETTVTCTSTDAALNATTHDFTITVTATAPIAAPTQAPAQTASGWNSTDVVVAWHWSARDAAIDAARCATSSTSSGEGSLTLTATCANVAGVIGTASHTVRVDRTKPVVSITDQPAARSNSAMAEFAFTTGDEGGSGVDTVTCKLDGSPAAPCATVSSHAYSGLAGGSHMFTVIATDRAGNSSQAAFTWCVTAKGPTIAVDHAHDGSKGWNRTSPVVLQITVTAGTAPVTDAPVCTDNGHPLPVTGAASPFGAAVTGEGTHTISCKARDTAGVSAIGTDKVRLDTVKPTVTVPADIAVAGPGADGMALTYAATFADATSGLATQRCTPASGSTFPVGVTTVTCSATDKAGNDASTSFTIKVTVQTEKPAREAKKAVLASLRDQLTCTTSRDLRGRLSAAIRHLQESLVPGLWVTSGPLDDGNHLDVARGEEVFEAEKAAVTSLMGIRRPSPAVQAAITTLDSADRLLAQTAIDDATAAGVDPQRLDGARKEMARAEAHLARGDFDLAIVHWKAAWRSVTPMPPTPDESCTH